MEMKELILNLPGRIYAAVDLDAIFANVAAAKAKTGVNVLAVIKADAYGHGAVQIARRLERDGTVWGFGVATSGEAMELRRAGIILPVLILGYVFPTDYRALIASEVRLTVFDYDCAREIAAAARSVGKRALVHLAFDSGMGRIGFAGGEAAANSAAEVAALEGIEIEGVFTHFSCADMTDKSYTLMQRGRFDGFLDALRRRGVEVPLVHMCNSAAIIDFDEDFRGLVRCGIMTYGLYPSAEVDTDFPLRPAMELKSRIVNVKRMAKGEAVSYGATYRAPCERVIATVPVGYADGYPRALSGIARVLVRGVSLPVVGRICMDQFMIDASAIPDIARGETVTLVGRDGGELITVEELADAAGSFNYEFVCGIARRVPRVYFEGGEVSEISDPLSF